MKLRGSSVEFVKTEETAEAATLLPSRPAGPQPIRINLLPPEIGEQRAFGRRRAMLGAVVGGVVVLIGGVWFVQHLAVGNAQDDLTAAQTRTTALQAEQAQYAEVPQVLGQVDDITAARAEGMALDVDWADRLETIARSAPTPVWVTSLSASLSEAAAGDAGALATSGIGSVTFTGNGLTHGQTAAWLDFLAEQPGYTDPFLNSSARAELDGSDVIDWTSTVTVTDSALTNRFAEGAQ